jgi:hypothetical protein
MKWPATAVLFGGQPRAVLIRNPKACKRVLFKKYPCGIAQMPTAAGGKKNLHL